MTNVHSLGIRTLPYAVDDACQRVVFDHSVGRFHVNVYSRETVDIWSKNLKEKIRQCAYIKCRVHMGGRRSLQLKSSYKQESVTNIEYLEVQTIEQIFSD